jgi:hypothetical protein
VAATVAFRRAKKKGTKTEEPLGRLNHNLALDAEASPGTGPSVDAEGYTLTIAPDCYMIHLQSEATSSESFEQGQL